MKQALVRDAVLRVGEVVGVEGRKILILVDKNKNASDLLLDGDVIRNISVGSYIEIRKGFLSLIGKIDGEKLKDEGSLLDNREDVFDKNYRVLSVSLSGYINSVNKFIGGIRELPLIGNEAFVLTDKKIQRIYSLPGSDANLTIDIASTDIEGIPIRLPVDGLFNSHIAIFGNTGSGKSNTLAALYQGLLSKLGTKTQSKFLFLDFNGEYTKPDCLSQSKKVYKLSTRGGGDKLPIAAEELFDIETLSILVEATEKTQKPFLKRTLRFYESAKSKVDYFAYTKAIIQNKVKDALKMTNKEVAFRILDYLDTVIHTFCSCDDHLREGLEFHNTCSQFMYQQAHISCDSDTLIERTQYFKTVDEFSNGSYDLTVFDELYIFLHLQLIDDLYRYKVQIDHVYPVVNRIKAKQSSIEAIFDVQETPDIWDGKQAMVVSLRDVNLDMRKTVPLLLAKEMYAKHKAEGQGTTFNIIVDEAHNILSKGSFRESADWKDYRLETFEEIIKEGRKFGVFLTISSQRPNDISETIISQAHNYFIHQLINQRDLQTIGSAVSYIDKVSEESIPTLPVGTCIFSGVATSMPLKLQITELPDKNKPESKTIKFGDLSTVEKV